MERLRKAETREKSEKVAAAKSGKRQKKETEVEVAGQKNLGAGMISERGED